jgi:hypothetical protein
MNFEEFKKSLNEDSPPENSNEYLKALWYDAKSDWHTAHKIVQSLNDQPAAWIHAYLHRKEGDMPNAGYWYNRADKEFSTLSLEEEWKFIVKNLLKD